MNDKMITADEVEAFRLSGELAKVCKRIIGDGPQAENDWAEMALHLHGVQNMLCRQVAGRALPGEIRLLGETLRPEARRAPTASSKTPELEEVRLGRNFLRRGDRVAVAPSRPRKRDGFVAPVLAIYDTNPVTVDVRDPSNGNLRTVPVGRLTRKRARTSDGA